MNIKSIEHHSARELISKLREVSMLKAPDVFPYAEATIELKTMPCSAVYPTQRYVLRSRLEQLRELDFAIQEQGIYASDCDFQWALFHFPMFRLNGYFTITLDSDEEIDLLPPIIERSIEADGTPVDLINDGAHRMFLARAMWINPQVVYVSTGLVHPYFSYPLRGQWSDVQIIEDMPEKGMLDRYHRIKDNKTLYRNFNSVFKAKSAPRGKIEDHGPFCRCISCMKNKISLGPK